MFHSLMWLVPPLNALPVWHISQSTASAGAAGIERSTGARGSARIHQSGIRPEAPPWATGAFGSGSTAIAQHAPRTRGEQGGGEGPGEDRTGRGSHGDPSSSSGQCSTLLPAPLLRRVVQLIVGNEGL